MKGLKIAVAVIGVLALAAGVYLVRLVSSLDTPEFQKSVLDRARAALGADVQVEEMRLSLFRGLTLRGVRVANPSGFQGPLLTADAFILRYRLLPLLRGRLEVERLSLEKPVLTLAANARGTWNYEKLGPAGTGSGKSAAPAAGKAPGGPAPGSPVELVLSRLSVDDAQLVMLGAKNAPLVKAEEADLASSFKLGGGAIEGSGKASIRTLSLADSLFVRNISAPLQIGKDKIQLDPVRGALAGGTVSGILSLRFKGGLRYAINLEVKGAGVQKILQEAGSVRSLSGTLQAKGWFEGSGGLATMTGGGRADIADCRVTDVPLMGVIAELLRVRELRNPSFDECRLEFTLAGSRLQTPVVRLLGPDIQLSGKGVTSLVDDTLRYDMTLALRKDLLDKVPAREMRAAFSEREGGFSAMDFKVTGTLDAPKTDLAARLSKATATELVKGGLGKLFKRRD